MSAEVIAATASRNARCTCPTLGLVPGITMNQLTRLGAGCTAGTGFSPGGICPRLDAVRRRYGK